ncbi:hypothetical protein CapIbe_017111 [Capra ibex]
MAEIPASPPEDRGSSGFPVAPNTGQIIGDRFLGLGWEVKLEVQSSGLQIVQHRDEPDAVSALLKFLPSKGLLIVQGLNCHLFGI